MGHVRFQCAVPVHAAGGKPVGDSVTPIDTRTGRPGRPRPVGCAVVVINLTTRQVYAPITVGGYPTAVAITA